MAVTKRTRFEVLRRDNHQCRYCGATADDAKLTVDHVTPVSLGGSDRPDNLVAACRDCNAGKASVSPDAALIDDVSAEQMEWGKRLHAALLTAGVEADNARIYRDEFQEHWDSYGSSSGAMPLPRDWIGTVDHWMGLRVPIGVLTNAIDIAMGNPRVRSGDVFKYMCGVVWRTIDDAREEASAHDKSNSVVVDSDELDAALAAEYQQGRRTGHRMAFREFAFTDIPHMLLQAVVDGDIRQHGGDFGGMRWVPNGS